MGMAGGGKAMPSSVPMDLPTMLQLLAQRQQSPGWNFEAPTSSQQKQKNMMDLQDRRMSLGDDSMEGRGFNFISPEILQRLNQYDLGGDVKQQRGPGGKPILPWLNQLFTKQT